MELPAGFRRPSQAAKPFKPKYTPTLVGLFTGAKAFGKGASFTGVEIRGVTKTKQKLKI
jgi:hypothetical protein